MQKIELCCEICQAKFNANYNTPKVLSCGHTVCSKCVERMKDKNLNKCPFDRKVLDFEDDKIAINYYILSLIDNSVEKNLVSLTEEDEIFTLNPKPVINSPGWKNTLDGFIKGHVMYTVETNGFIYCTDLKSGEWWFMYHNQFFGNFLFQVGDNMYLIDQYGSLFQIFNKNYYVQLGKKNIWKNTTHLTVFNNKVFSIEATNKFFETTLKNGKYKEIVITKDNINLNPTASYFFSPLNAGNFNNANLNNNLIIAGNNTNNNLINSKNIKNNVINQNATGIGNSNKNAAAAGLCNMVSAGHYENKENVPLNTLNTLNNINNVKRVKFLDKLNGNGTAQNQNFNGNSNCSNNNANKNANVNSSNANQFNILEKPAIAASANTHMNSHANATTTLVNNVGIPSNYNYEGNLSGMQANGLNGTNIHAMNYLSSDDYETKIFKNVNMLFSTKKLIFFSNKSGEMFSYNDKNKEIKLVKTNFFKNIESYSTNSTHVYFFEKNSKIIYRMDIAYSEKDKEKDYNEELFSNFKCKCKKICKKNKNVAADYFGNPSDLDVNEFTENIINEDHINCKNISNGNCNQACNNHLSGNSNILVVNNNINNLNKIQKSNASVSNVDNVINRNIKNLQNITSSNNISNNNNVNNKNNNCKDANSNKHSNNHSNCNSKCSSKSKNDKFSKNSKNVNLNKEFVEKFDKIELNDNNNNIKNKPSNIKQINNNNTNNSNTTQKPKTSDKTINLDDQEFANQKRVNNIYNNYDPYDYIDSDIIQSDDEGNELYIEITNQNFLNCEPFFNLESINKELTPIKIIASNSNIVIIDKIGEIYTIDLSNKTNKCFQCLFMLRNCHLSNSSIIGDGDLLLLDPIRLSLNKLNILAGTEVIVLHSSKFLYTIKNIFSANSRIYFIDVSGNLYYFNEVDKKLTQIGNNGICKYILDLAVYKNFLLTIENNTLYRTSLADGNYTEIKNDFVKNYEYFFADNSNIIFISKEDDIQILSFGSASIFNHGHDKQSSTRNVNNININSLTNEQINLQANNNANSNNNNNNHCVNLRTNAANVSNSQPVSSSNVVGKISGNTNQLYLKSSFKYDNICRMHAITYFRNNIVFYNIKTGCIESINIEDRSHKIMIENFPEISQFINNNDFLACILKNGVIYKLYC